MKRRTWRIALCAVCILAVALGAAIIGVWYKRRPPFKLIPLETLLKYYDDHEPVFLDVFYLPWSAHTLVPMREEKLTSRNPFVRIQGLLGYTHRVDAMSVLKNVPLERMSPSLIGLNFRYSCIFLTRSREATQVSLALGTPIVLTVNGEQFEAPPKLVDSLIQLLPVREYIVMHKDLEEDGFFEPGRIYDEFQNSPYFKE